MLSILIGTAPCRASATYSFTDLGPAEGGNLTFDAQGQINPKTISTYSAVRLQSGPYSISWHYADGRPLDLYRALAVTDGQAPVEIAPPQPVGGFYQATLASAVNSFGTYVGTAFGQIINGYLGVAFMYNRYTGTQAVPTPNAGLSSGLSINDAGLIVGISGGRAFLSDGTSSWDLNTLVDPGKDFLLTNATDINDRGQIVGEAFDSANNSVHYYLLTPEAVPEPSTLVLVASGCLAYPWLRRIGRR